MKMTFVTSDGVKQEATIYIADIMDAEDMAPDASTTKKAMLWGWFALRRQGDETRTWDEWRVLIKSAPEIEAEPDDPKALRDALSADTPPSPDTTGAA